MLTYHQLCARTTTTTCTMDISAPRQRQLLEPGAMGREEPGDHLRSHGTRNIAHSSTPSWPIHARWELYAISHFELR